MKKIFLTFACFSLVFAGASAAFAADGQSSQTAAGDTVTITAGSISGAPSFTFTPSPSVQITAYIDHTNGNAYAMETTNSVTNATDGMVYAASNTSTGYAQRQKTSSEVTNGLTDLTSTSIPSGDWAWMGGSS